MSAGLCDAEAWLSARASETAKAFFRDRPFVSNPKTRKARPGRRQPIQAMCLYLRKDGLYDRSIQCLVILQSDQIVKFGSALHLL